jgi:predicted RNase H-like HicB family nuclease
MTTYKFRTIYGVTLHNTVVLDTKYDPITGDYSNTTVTMELVEIKGVVVHADTMLDAYDMLDEMLDVFLELEIGLELTGLGFKYDNKQQYFYVES